MATSADSGFEENEHETDEESFEEKHEQNPRRYKCIQPKNKGVYR